MTHQPFARAVHESQELLIVKCKNGYIDFFHDLSQQRSGFQSSEPLFAQRCAELINFQHDIIERITWFSTLCANRVIPFMQSSKHVGNCLQRTNNFFARGKSKAEPEP